LGVVYSNALSIGEFAAGFLYYDAGQIELNWIERGELKTKYAHAQKDILALLSCGRKLTANLRVGATFKFASSSLVERSAAYAFAGDAGILLLLGGNFRICGALQNFGSSTEFLAEKTPLPFSVYISGGASYLTEKLEVLPAVEVTYNFAERETIPEAGIEFCLGEFSLVVGYRFAAQDANLHFGLRYLIGSLSVGYAYIPGIYVDPTHRIDIGFRTGN